MTSRIVNLLPSLSSGSLQILLSELTKELETKCSLMNTSDNLAGESTIFSPTQENITTEKMKERSRGANSFKTGNLYERKIHTILSNITIEGESFSIRGDSAGAKAGSDIILETSARAIGFEVKDAGAFEGGSKKLTYRGNTLGIEEDCIHKDIIGDRILYEGANFPWYCNKKTAEDWKAVESVFKPEIYIDAPSDAVANYYKRVGTHYIQIEKYGLFHTGCDILSLGVPFFTTNIRLRIRSSKHIKNGIPTDITAALQYDKKALPKSPYSLDGLLPPAMKTRFQVAE